MNTKHQPDQPQRNPDPLTDAPGSHPVGTGIGGAVGGAIAGAAIGTVAGPVGTAIGATIGAIAGGLAGKAVAETVNPTLETDMSPSSSYSPLIPSAVAADYQTVATRAYYRWEDNGRSDGHALDDWLAAESELRQPL